MLVDPPLSMGPLITASGGVVLAASAPASGNGGQAQ
jgi:hypothetical protein